jgi:aminopeptidase N
MRQVLNPLVYEKAAWVLHMLRAEVGTEQFWTAIREYYQRYRNQTTSTDELRAIFEQVSSRRLDWFFTQWLTRPGIPTLGGSWRYDAATKRVEVTLTQSQAVDAFRLNVDIGIVATPGAMPRVERMVMTDRQARMSFPTESEPADVTIDPGTWLLMGAGAFVQTR